MTAWNLPMRCPTCWGLIGNAPDFETLIVLTGEHQAACAGPRPETEVLKTMTAEMYRSRYWEMQEVLDQALGRNAGDGSGGGIVEDLKLVIRQRDNAQLFMDGKMPDGWMDRLTYTDDVVPDHVLPPFGAPVVVTRRITLAFDVDEKLRKLADGRGLSANELAQEVVTVITQGADAWRSAYPDGFPSHG